jgi:hypothetical protein
VEPSLLQDFISLRGASNIQVVQTATSWLDLGDAEDITLYTDVREASGGGQLTFETSATMLDSQFVALVPQFTLATGLRTDVVLASMAKIPPARFVRWRFNSAPGAPGQATFRVWAATYRWA